MYCHIIHKRTQACTCYLHSKQPPPSRLREQDCRKCQDQEQFFSARGFLRLRDPAASRTFLPSSGCYAPTTASRAILWRKIQAARSATGWPQSRLAARELYKTLLSSPYLFPNLSPFLPIPQKPPSPTHSQSPSSILGFREPSSTSPL